MWRFGHDTIGDPGDRTRSAGSGSSAERWILEEKKKTHMEGEELQTEGVSLKKTPIIQ